MTGLRTTIALLLVFSIERPFSCTATFLNQARLRSVPSDSVADSTTAMAMTHRRWGIMGTGVLMKSLTARRGAGVSE